METNENEIKHPVGNFARINATVEGAIHQTATIQDVPISGGNTMKQARFRLMTRERQSNGIVSQMPVDCTFPVNSAEDEAFAAQLKAGALIHGSGVMVFRTYALKAPSGNPAIVASNPETEGGRCQPVTAARSGRTIFAEGVNTTVRFNSSADIHVVKLSDVQSVVANLSAQESIYNDMEAQPQGEVAA